MKILKTYFEEKNLPFEEWNFDINGNVHFISNEFIIDVILNATPRFEQEEIWSVIRRIDFKNGNVNHFLRHLAEGYIKNNYERP